MVWFDAVTAAELIAGCRCKRERRTVDRLLSPFEGASRVACPERGDFDRAARAMSRLRERGRTLSHPGSALLDGLIAMTASRLGALLVTANIADFEMLSTELSLEVKAFDAFRSAL